MAFGWAKPLIGIGVTQMLLSVGMIAVGGLSIAACQQLFHTSWAIFTGVFLFVLGAANVSGCNCTPRTLLGLGIINFIMIGAAVAAIASGAIGVRCELSGAKEPKYDGASCYSFAKEIKCVNDRWMSDKAANVSSINGTSDSDFKSHRTKGMAINGVVLGTGLIILILCVAAAVISIRARGVGRAGQDDVVAPPPQIMVQTPTGQDVVLVAGPHAYEQEMDAQSTQTAGATQSLSVPQGGINIQNVNDVNVCTSLNGGEVMTDAGRGGSARSGSSRQSETLTESQPSQRSSSSCSSRSNRSSSNKSSRRSSRRSNSKSHSSRRRSNSSRRSR